MPDTLVNLTSPAEPTTKTRCAKKAPRRAVKPSTQPSEPTASSTADDRASVLPSLIFHEADQIEIGARRARISLGLTWEVIDDVSALSGKGEALGDRLYLLLGVVSDAIDDSLARAGNLADAAREMKSVGPKPQGPSNDEELTRRFMELTVAEDALNKDENDNAAIIAAYNAANDRFLEASACTPAGILLKLERLAEVGDSRNDPALATNAIILSLIDDLRAITSTSGQVQ